MGGGGGGGGGGGETANEGEWTGKVEIRTKKAKNAWLYSDLLQALK